MSRRARRWELARELKHADAYSAPDTDREADDEPAWQQQAYSCPYCGKSKAEPFHCTACNYPAEGH